jgi:hypothetical protein
VTRSDLSGEHIEGDTPASVIYVLEGGKRRKLTVTRAEADQLANQGHDVTRIQDRLAGRIKLIGPKALLWLAGLFVASLAIPALTKQWSDRQGELELKDRIITSVSRDAAVAFRDGLKISDERSPTKARSESRRAADAWVVGHAETDARYAVYFRNTKSEDHWRAFEAVIYRYITLACCDRNRPDDLQAIRHYMARSALPEPDRPPVARPWETLRCGPHEECRVQFRYAQTYGWLGTELLRGRGQLLDDLRTESATGFSKGPGDFLHDVFSPINPS